MKNFVAITLFLVLGSVSCSACNKQEQTPPVEVPVPVVDAGVSTTTVVRNDNLEVTLPNDGWVEMKVPEGLPVKAFMNSTLKNLVLLSKQADDSTYEQFVLNALREMKGSGATVVSTKQVTLNGHKFVVIDSTRNNVQFFMWIALENGFGYSFACGGPAALAPHDLCFSIANTVKL